MRLGLGVHSRRARAVGVSCRSGSCGGGGSEPGLDGEATLSPAEPFGGTMGNSEIGGPHGSRLSVSAGVGGRGVGEVFAVHMLGRNGASARDAVRNSRDVSGGGGLHGGC